VIRIAIDAHTVGTKLGGNESYAVNLIEALAQIDSANNYTIYVLPTKLATGSVIVGPISKFAPLFLTRR